MLWNHSDFFFYCCTVLKIYQTNKEYIFCAFFFKDVYRMLWTSFKLVYLYFKDKQILKIVKKLMFFFFQMLNVKCFLKTVWGYPYWKYAPFLHILNDNMYMMLSVCCFWIFDKKKRCVKSWVSFLIEMIFFPLTYAWIWIPSGFIKAVNFKIFFFNYNG